MKKIICDICGKEVYAWQGYASTAELVVSEIKIVKDAQNGTILILDVCEDCTEKLINKNKEGCNGK